MSTSAPVSATAHVAQVARHAQAPRKVAAHRQPRGFEGLVLTTLAHRLIFGAGVVASGLVGAGAWVLVTGI